MVSIPTSDSSLDESATLEVQPVEDQQFLSALQQLFLEGNIKLKDQESTSGTLAILKTQEKEDEVFLLSGSSSGGPDVTGDSGYVVVIPGTSPYPDYGDYDSPYIPPDEWDANYHDNGASQGGGGDSSGGAEVDWSFIEELEGNRLDGYIPKDGNVILGNSGVTIASGLDLGQNSLAGLKELNLSKDLTDKLSPYLELKGTEAQAKLDSIPLNITATEALEINSAVHGKALNDLVVKYDSAVGAGEFYKLPTEAQTVIASVGFQYGNLATSAPKFWAEATSKDWSGAISELRDFGDVYNTRRSKEADLLQRYLNN